MVKKYFLLAVLFTGALTGNILWAEEKSLWNYALPSADAIVYINTKQAEKAMTPVLWQQIQKDKNKALEEDSEDQLFDTQNRDVETVINLFINSVLPFKASIEGVAMITGNVKDDIAKLLQVGQGADIPAPQIMRQGDLDFYHYTLSGDEKMPPANFTFSLDKGGLLHFRAAVNPAPKQSVALSSVNAAKKATLVSGMEQKDLSFAASIKTDKFLTLPASTADAGKLKDFLNKLNTILVTGRVQGNFLQINIALSAKNSQLAGELYQMLQPILKQVSIGFGQQVEGVSSNIKNSDVLIAGNINIAVAWNLISSVTEQPQPQQVSPQ